MSKRRKLRRVSNEKPNIIC
ncbi:Protein CBG27151 [Caenorhabditis briggsae]|uniref:Protein CBG27151 n=1 Tax=Caenorhabditis briggsae TaxID=6238 RepID=B6IL61_CAEBR|nr:Protein CBG27151 [Caenorhabditis briggsae]CAS00614.1 Protein CBG27151 [Caenorhabditis briggsae]